MFPRLATVALASLLALTSQLASAQTTFETLGHVYLSFEPDQIVEHRTVQPFEPFDVYVLADFEGVSPAINLSFAQAGLRFDESIAFSTIEMYDPGIASLHGLEPGFVEVSPFFHACPDTWTELRPMLHLQAILQEPASNVFIGIEGVQSDPTLGGLGPGWGSCHDGGLYLFGKAEESWSKLTINGPVATDTHTWSLVKSTYDGKEAP